ncbi:MAG: hypothetical protein AB7H85_11385 [Dehalococcoidia bacterium]
MDPARPMMLLRARPSDAIHDRFVPWFQKVHLRDIERIPGISGVRSGRTPGGVFLGFYEFSSAEAVQPALASPQAAYARGTWEQWSSDLSELFIELWAPVGPLPLYHPIN